MICAAHAAGPPALPVPLQLLIEEFASARPVDRLPLLLEYGDDLLPLPTRLADPAGTMERVAECQSPVYLLLERDGLEPDGARADGVRLFVSAPAQAPVTRGFAGLLTGVVGQLSVREVIDLPLDLPQHLGLGKDISPLRLRGMTGLLVRVQQQARALNTAPLSETL